MTDHTCDGCGDPLQADRDKSHQRYRDRCLPCLLADAEPERHVDSCDRDDCPVCDDYRREFGGE